MKRFKTIRQYARCFAGENGGGSAAGTASQATAGAGSAASTSAGNGAQTANSQTNAPTAQTQTDTKPFKSFATQADFDREIQQALKSREESMKAKLTPEIKAQVEKESKMTAEQKVQAQLDELNNQKAELAKAKCRLKAESLLVSRGVTDDVARSTMLDSVVTEDETETLKRTQTLVDAIDKATNEKIKEAMKKVKKPDSDNDPGDNGTSAAVKLAKGFAKRRAAESKASNDILKQFIDKN